MDFESGQILVAHFRKMRKTCWPNNFYINKKYKNENSIISQNHPVQIQGPEFWNNEQILHTNYRKYVRL